VTEIDHDFRVLYNTSLASSPLLTVDPTRTLRQSLSLPAFRAVAAAARAVTVDSLPVAQPWPPTRSLTNCGKLEIQAQLLGTQLEQAAHD
jgi:hypothetical protein